MKLRNRWTKEFGRLNCIRENEKSWFEVETKGNIYKYNSLAKLNEDWQDYEEPEVIYYLSWDGVVLHSADKTGWQDAKQIGNYFETEEEAEEAVEKLKAWKRLKDKGFKVDLWDYDGSDSQGRIITGKILFRVKDYAENDDDLDLLLGVEE